MLGVRSKVVLIVKDKRKGVIRKRESEGNTILKNFMRLIQDIIWTPITGNLTSYIDINGVYKQFHYSYPLYVNGNEAKMAIGSGNTPVNFNDYNLANKIKGWDYIDNAEYNYDDANFKGTFKAYKEWRFTTETDIWEVGLAFPYNSTGGLTYSMTDRVVLDTAFTVPANKTVGVYYILEFSKK